MARFLCLIVLLFGVAVIGCGGQDVVNNGGGKPSTTPPTTGDAEEDVQTVPN